MYIQGRDRSKKSRRIEDVFSILNISHLLVPVENFLNTKATNTGGPTVKISRNLQVHIYVMRAVAMIHNSSVTRKLLGIQRPGNVAYGVADCNLILAIF